MKKTIEHLKALEDLETTKAVLQKAEDDRRIEVDEVLHHASVLLGKLQKLEGEKTALIELIAIKAATK